MSDHADAQHSAETTPRSRERSAGAAAAVEQDVMHHLQEAAHHTEEAEQHHVEAEYHADEAAYHAAEADRHAHEAELHSVEADHHVEEAAEEVVEAIHARTPSAHSGAHDEEAAAAEQDEEREEDQEEEERTTESEVVAEKELTEEQRTQHVADNINENFLEHEMPSVEALRAARVQLTEQIRHHKDEQDSLALDIECQEGAAELYHIAARLYRFEQFCKRAHAHVEETMSAEVARVVATDKHHSEEEIAHYAKELQERRERILKRIAAAKEKPVKGRTANAQAHAKEPKLEEADRQTIQHVQEAESSAAALDAKVRKFRTMKSKLEAEIIAAERQSKHAEEQLKLQIKRAQLDNARDTRQCRELNARNATMTAAAQMLMSELNAEHYGIDAVPTPEQLAARYKALQMSPEPTPKETPPLYPQPTGSQQHVAGSQRSSSHPQASTSSRQSLSKPPLVAIKSTASQRSRENQIKKERAETIHSSRRSSEYAAPLSRRASETRPPLHDAPSRRSHDNASQVSSDIQRAHVDPHAQPIAA